VAAIPYRTARADAANYAEMGKRVAPAIKAENYRTATPWQRAQVIVTRGTYGDSGEADPPLSMRQQRERDSTSSGSGSTVSSSVAPNQHPTRPAPAPRLASTAPAQLDLAGGANPLTGSREQLALVDGGAFYHPHGLGRQRPSTGDPSRYDSTAWGGTVLQPNLEEG